AGAVAFASCAEPRKPMAPAVVAPLGSHFEDAGNVTLHAGQPCASQIMFDFKGANLGRTVWLAARMKDSKVLTDAASHGKRVHIWGAWHRGRESGCSYVDVTRVE